MKKGVINIVEVLILILIFLGAAALFASFLLSSTTQQAEAIKQQQQSLSISLNPPVKVIGIIQVQNDMDGDRNDDTLPIACVQETTGKYWWLSGVQLIAGVQGTALKIYDPGSKLASLLNDPNVQGNSTWLDNIAEVTYAPLNPVLQGTVHYNNTLVICINTTSNTIYNITTANFTCDQAHDSDLLNTFVSYCQNALGNSYKLEIINLVQFVPPGSVAPVIGPANYSRNNWAYDTMSLKIYFASKILPSPGNIPLKKLNGENVTTAEVIDVLKSNRNMTNFYDVFQAQCESCTFVSG